jgi:Uma2 family endonuclease
MPTTLVAGPQYELDAADLVLAAKLPIETDEPVESPYHSRQHRLLTTPLENSWTPPAAAGAGRERRFWVDSDVGMYGDPFTCLVPDVFVSLDVSPPTREVRRTYFFWVYRKPPEIVVEIVSGPDGNELTHKKEQYAAWGIKYYVVFDPGRHLGADDLHIFVLDKGRYRNHRGTFFPELGVGLTRWRGEYSNAHDEYIRWCDRDGKLLPTGREERDRADAEKRRADQLMARLRELGIEP